jgi:hypothetical protein
LWLSFSEQIECETSGPDLTSFSIDECFEKTWSYKTTGANEQLERLIKIEENTFFYIFSGLKAFPRSAVDIDTIL